MKKMILIGLALTAFAFAAEKVATVTVDKLVLCTHVENREAKDKVLNAASNESKIYCWFTASNIGDCKSVTLSWWYKGQCERSTDLAISGVTFRTWGHKTIYPWQAGDWTVKVNNGTQVLSSLDFVAKP